ncbi:MAG: F0F1 ATP synthase subunit A [Bacilli bacterium]|nr:F0F1 ATP synthase subunit A [Bacilli bacterium]
MSFPFFSGDPLSDMIASFGDPTFRISGPTISSLVVIGIVAILAIIVGIQAHFHDPMKPARGPLGLACGFVEWIDQWATGLMGKNPGNWTGYFLGLFCYLFLAFIWSITGFPSIIDTLIMPLALSLVMFILIQFTGIRYQKWKYFHRYIEPISIFLPVNLITMWTPIISTTLRMFGNALAGSVIMGLLNWALKNASVAIFSGLAAGYADPLNSPAAIFLSPIPMGVLNLYFGLFSGLIQTLVFASLNGVWIGAELPETDPMGTARQVTRPKKEQNA